MNMEQKKSDSINKELNDFILSNMDDYNKWMNDRFVLKNNTIYCCDTLIIRLQMRIVLN